MSWAPRLPTVRLHGPVLHFDSRCCKDQIHSACSRSHRSICQDTGNDQVSSFHSSSNVLGRAGSGISICGIVEKHNERHTRQAEYQPSHYRERPDCFISSYQECDQPYGKREREGSGPDVNDRMKFNHRESGEGHTTHGAPVPVPFLRQFPGYASP